MKGSCNCGKVSFEILGDHVAGIYQCHCKLCQKQSGSTSNTATIVNGSDFIWSSGVDSITHWKKESGFTSHFCKYCGCPVPNKLEIKFFTSCNILFNNMVKFQNLKRLFILITLFSLAALAQIYKSVEDGQVPEMTIRLFGGYAYMNGAAGTEYGAKAILQHAEIYFSVPNNCECGVKAGEYSGVPTSDFLELFTPYFGVLPIEKNP